MDIVGKTYRNIKPTDGLVNYHSFGYSKIKEITYIYIYNSKIASIHFTTVESLERYLKERNHIPGNLNPPKNKFQLKNREKRIKEGNDFTNEKYRIYDINHIEIQRYSFDKDEWEISFKGNIFLDGDAIRGVFYNKGKIVTPVRVYYNVDKPLPNPLLDEHEQIDDENLDGKAP